VWLGGDADADVADALGLSLTRRPGVDAPPAKQDGRSALAQGSAGPALYALAGLRIIAGTHRGRRIAAPKGAHTRPTGDRVREALFNIVGPVEGASVLDLYAGSGALGLEALSRGARRCMFVETDAAACRAIRGNLETLGLTGGLVVQRDALAVLREERSARRRHELVLLDPPYERWVALEARLAELLPAVVAESGVVVAETAARIEPTLPFDLVTTRRYGSARLTVFTPHATASTP
jgi:16S rRNA (guanine966-N2)-methyltransferase